MSSDSTPYREPLRPAWLHGRSVPGWLQGLWARPELLAVAVVAGVYHAKGLYKGKPFDHYGRFTDTWAFLNGKWVCVASHTSALKKKP